MAPPAVRVAAHDTGEPRRAPVGGRARAWSVLVACAAVGDRQRACAPLVEFIALLVLAQMWNLLAGYAGLVSIGQQAYVGLGGYALSCSPTILGVNPFLAVPLAGLVAGRARAAHRGARLPLPGRLLRGRHLGGRRGLPPARRQHGALGRGIGRTLKAVVPAGAARRAS